ncbi:MAG: hypothetical protein ACXVWU_07580 [Nocardioides sp.]
MTDDQQRSDRPQGPTDPHGAGGLDAPAPPGGPQRSDAPAGPDTPGTPGQDPGTQVKRVTRPEGEGDVPEPQGEPGGQHGDQRDVERAEQAENAGTALDEPSDGSGGE